MKKAKVAFIFCHPGCEPQKDRTILDTANMIMYIVGCSTYTEAEEAAREMLGNGCQAIDLCGAFGFEGTARIKKAVEHKIPVGVVNFDFHPIFREKSGDEMFQKDFWCAGI